MPIKTTIFRVCTASLGNTARRLPTMLLLLLLPWHSDFAADQRVENPSRVKAAFLRNFTHYVTWPAQAFDNQQSPWRIGVLGDAAFGAVVATALTGRTEQERAFEVHIADSLSQLPACQIIYIALQDPHRRRAALAALQDKPVLTVGDAPDILQAGAIIRFQLDERVRMSINLDQARAAELIIQTRMLEVSPAVLENGVIRKLR